MKKTWGFLQAAIALILFSFTSNAQNNVSFWLDISGECEPVTVVFNNTTSINDFQGVVNYKWYLNGEDLYFGLYPPDYILNKGNHRIELEVCDDLGILGVFSTDILVKGVVNDFIIIPGSQVCPGEDVSFRIEPEPFSAEWDFGDGNFFNPDAYSLYPWHRYSEAGNYAVTLVASNNCGTDTITKEIEVKTGAIPEPKPYIMGSGPVCPNEELRFDVLGSYQDYLWDFGDGHTSDEKSPTHVYGDQDAASYTVNLTVWNSCGGSASAGITAFIESSVTANASFHWKNSFMMDPCPNNDIQFMGEFTGNHKWIFSDGGTAEGKEIEYSFASPGEYQVTHIVQNACGDSDTLIKSLVVSENISEMVTDLSFYFDIPSKSHQDKEWLDTLTVCPGEMVHFINTSYYENAVEYEWDFGDNVYLVSRDASHRFTNEGFFTVTLNAKTACGGTSSISKYVKVDNTVPLTAELGVAPFEICPGERVYFFDNEFETDNNYTYRIEFGDGDLQANITGMGNTELGTLAEHEYPDEGSYEFTFSAENLCGNKVETTGTIVVSSNVQVPFYYVTNSSRSDEDVIPQDWSTQKNETDHQFSIPVKWTEWQPTYSDSFYVFFWYGGLDTENDPGKPDGYISFQSSNIAEGEIVTAWIPVNIAGEQKVGMAAGYFCPGEMEFGEEPEVWGTLMGSDMQLIKSLALEPSGSTDITDHSPEGILITQVWDEICNSEDPEGRWYRKIQEGVYAMLEIYSDSASLNHYYNMYYVDDPVYYNQHQDLTSGEYLYPGDGVTEIEFLSGDLCGENGRYQVVKNGPDLLSLQILNDGCNDRSGFLTGEFIRWKESHEQPGTCPGDPVKFIVAGGESYVWDFGDGESSTERNPQHIYSEPGEYIATLSATNACGRTDEITTLVKIDEGNIPKPDFYIENHSLYVRDSIFFGLNHHDEFEFDPYEYVWDFGDGNTAEDKYPVHIYSEPGDYTVRLKVINSCGEGSVTRKIHVMRNTVDCEAKFTFTATGQDVNFMDISSGNPVAWEWDFGDGTGSGLQNPFHTYSLPGIYPVMLTIFDDRTQCVSYTERIITVGNVACVSDFDFIVNPTLRLTRFTNTSLNADQYYWEFGDGEISMDPSPEHFYRENGEYKVCLTVTDASGNCQDRTCKEIFVGSTDAGRIKADFSFFRDDAGTTVNFQDLSTGPVTNWYWTLGDGSTHKQQSFQHSYPEPGFYEVCLSVFNEVTGNTDENCKMVKAGDPGCNLEAFFNYYVFPLDNSVRFTDKSKGNYTNWYWNFGDGNASESQNPNHKYEEPGMYLVTLSVRDDDNTCMDQYAELIQVGKVECEAEFRVAVNPDENQVHFFNRSSGPIMEYYWDFGNGTFSDEENPTITYKKAGTYEVTLTVEDSTGSCMDKASRTVQVGNIDCSAKFEVFVDSLNATAYFSQVSSGQASAILWSFGDGAFSSNPEPVHKYAAPGFYTVGLNIYNSNSDCMDYFEEVILISGISTNCKADFIYKPSEDGSTLFFMDKSQGNIVDWFWNFGDGYVDHVQDPTHFYSQDGYYLSCLTVTNDAGVRNMTCDWVPVLLQDHNDCRANFMFTVDSINLKAKFKDDSYGNPDMWFWDFGDGNTSTLQNPEHQYQSEGYYLVSLKTFNSINQCRSSESKLLNVGEDYILKAAFTYDTDTSRYKADGYPVDFVGASSGDGATYEWDFGDNKLKSFIVMAEGSRIVRHYYQDPGYYTACLRVTDQMTGHVDISCETVQAGPTSVIPSAQNLKAEVNAMPNPASDYTRLKYRLAQDESIEIAVYDVSGNRVETLIKSKKTEGEHELLWDVSGFPEGIYLVKFVSSGNVSTLPVIIAK